MRIVVVAMIGYKGNTVLCHGIVKVLITNGHHLQQRAISLLKLFAKIAIAGYGQNDDDAMSNPSKECKISSSSSCP